MRQRTLNIVVFGAAKVGKSALIERFCSNTFRAQYEPTIQDNYRHQIELEGKQVSLEILDTGANESSIGMRDLDISHGDGFVLVFDLTDDLSLIYLTNVVNQIALVKDGNVPLVLVGTKSDLERKVNIETARRMASEWGCKLIETSSRTGENVDKVFCHLVEQIKRADIEDSDRVKEKRDKCIIM